MKIAHVTATFPPYEGGTGNVCYHNAVQLGRRGHQVTVFTAAHPPGDYGYPGEITVRRLPIAFRFGNAPFLPGLLAINDFDLIHLHHPFIFGAELIWAVSRLRRIPYLMTHHNDLIGSGYRKYLFRTYSAISNRLVVAGASRCIVVSRDHAIACRLTPMYRKKWQAVIEMPNGVDTQIFRPGLDGKSVRARYGIDNRAKLILFVGALDRAHHFKGVDYLIRAFSRMRDSETSLMVIGGGDLKSTFLDLAQKQGVAERAIFTGSIPNVQLPPYYNAADLVVLPSLPPESFGLVLVEAMACARPVLAHDIPGVRSVVSHGEDGFLVKPKDMEDLTEKLHLMLGSPDLRMAMGARGRAKVLKRFSWDQIGEQLEAVYERLIQEHPIYSSSISARSR